MIEQFLFYLSSDGNYHFLKSGGVSRIISDANLQDLRLRCESNGEPYWLPTEQIIAIQRIEATSDKSGRRGTWNHTLLIPIRDYIRLTDPYRLLSKHFLLKTGKPPENLESI